MKLTTCWAYFTIYGMQVLVAAFLLSSIVMDFIFLYYCKGHVQLIIREKNNVMQAQHMFRQMMVRCCQKVFPMTSRSITTPPFLPIIYYHIIHSLHSSCLMRIAASFQRKFSNIISASWITKPFCVFLLLFFFLKFQLLTTSRLSENDNRN